MNRERRKEALRIAALFEEAREALSALAEEERAAYENMPEGLQSGPTGEALDESATELEDLDSTAEDLIERLTTLGGGST